MRQCRNGIVGGRVDAQLGQSGVEHVFSAGFNELGGDGFEELTDDVREAEASEGGDGAADGRGRRELSVRAVKGGRRWDPHLIFCISGEATYLLVSLLFAVFAVLWKGGG